LALVNVNIAIISIL